MKINPIKNIILNTASNLNNTRQNYMSMPVLKADTVSFGSIKQDDFDETDEFFMEKYNPPTDKIKNKDELKVWAKDFFLEKFGGISSKIENISGYKNGDIAQDWYNNCLHPYNSIHSSEQIEKSDDNITSKHLTGIILVMDAIVNDIIKNPEKDFPIFNRSVLAKILPEYEKEIVSNFDTEPDLSDMYREELESFYKDIIKGRNNSWITIKLTKKDKNKIDYPKIVDTLRILAEKTSPNGNNLSYNTDKTIEKVIYNTNYFYIKNGKPVVRIEDEILSKKHDLKFYDENGICVDKLPKKYLRETVEGIIELRLEPEDNSMVSNHLLRYIRNTQKYL